MPLESVREAIRAAFPSIPFVGPATNCQCDECRSIDDELRKRRWTDVSASLLDSTCSPTLLTPAAMQAFVPAYMLRALDRLYEGHDVVVEFTTYSLSPHSIEDEEKNEYQKNKLIECYSLMTPNQVRAVRMFLECVANRAPDAEWLHQFIEPALRSIWMIPTD